MNQPDAPPTPRDATRASCARRRTCRAPRLFHLALALALAAVAAGLPGCDDARSDPPRSSASDEASVPPEEGGGTAAAQPGESAAEASASTAAPEPEAALQRPSAPRLEPEAAPQGPPGPVELPIAGAPTAAQLGGIASTPALAALAYRVEAPGEGCLDSQLERCHRWYVVVAPRDGSRKPTQILIGESDTPSGIEVEALLPLGERLLALSRDGRYTGDEPRLVASFIDADGTVRAQHDLLPGAGHEVRDATAAALDDTHAVVCWSGDDARRDNAIERLRERHIWCRRVGPDGIDDGATLLGGGSGPHRAPVIGFRDGHGLLAWVRHESLEVLPVDAQLRPVGEVVVLGPATPRQPAIVPGHGGFLVVWQDPRGGSRAQRLELEGSRFAAPIDLGGHGIRFVTHGGATAVPQGFLVAATPDSWTRLVLVDPLGESATLLSSKEDTARVHLGGADSLVEVTRKRKGRVVWRSAASMLREPEAAAAAPTAP